MAEYTPPTRMLLALLLMGGLLALVGLVIASMMFYWGIIYTLLGLLTYIVLFNLINFVHLVRFLPFFIGYWLTWVVISLLWATQAQTIAIVALFLSVLSHIGVHLNIGLYMNLVRGNYADIQYWQYLKLPATQWQRAIGILSRRKKRGIILEWWSNELYETRLLLERESAIKELFWTVWEEQQFVLGTEIHLFEHSALELICRTDWMRELLRNAQQKTFFEEQLRLLLEVALGFLENYINQPENSTITAIFLYPTLETEVDDFLQQTIYPLAEAYPTKEQLLYLYSLVFVAIGVAQSVRETPQSD